MRKNLNQSLTLEIENLNLEIQRHKHKNIILKEKISELKKENEFLKMNLYSQNSENEDDYDRNRESKLYKIINSDENQSEEYEHKTLDLSYRKAIKLKPHFSVLDFETTGLNFKKDEIFQYGVVRVTRGKITKEFTKYFKPTKPLSKTVMKKTGITNEFLADKPKLTKDDLIELLGHLNSRTIVAHNAPFDMKFLLKALYDFKIPHNRFRVFDTLKFSRRLINETENHKLETLKEYFNLDDGKSHEALNDAKATANLALILIDRMEEN